MRNAVALVVGIVLALVLGELVARLALPPPPIVSVDADPDLGRRLAGERDQPRELAEHDENAPGGPFMLETPTGLRLRASTRVQIAEHWLSERPVDVRTNSLGYRNPELGPKSRRRVLFLAVMQARWAVWAREIADRFPPADGGEVLRDVGAFNRLIGLSVADWGSAWAEGAWERMIPVLAEFQRRLIARWILDFLRGR